MPLPSRGDVILIRTLWTSLFSAGGLARRDRTLRDSRRAGILRSVFRGRVGRRGELPAGRTGRILRFRFTASASVKGEPDGPVRRKKRTDPGGGQRSLARLGDCRNCDGEGGECGFSHLPDRADDERQRNRRRVSLLTDPAPTSQVSGPARLSKDEDIRAVMDDAAKFGKIDFLLHSIAYALAGRPEAEHGRMQPRGFRHGDGDQRL